MGNDKSARQDEFSETEMKCEEKVVNSWYRVTVPPHKIMYPGDPETRDRTDPWNSEYLGEHMAEEPSLDFESLSLSGESIRDMTLFTIGDRTYYAELFESANEVYSLIDGSELPDDADFSPESVEFDDVVIVLVASGGQPTNSSHRWARVERVDDAVHLHGYHQKPHFKMGAGPCYSLLAIERPDGDLRSARVSLTVDDCDRVHFDSSDDYVRLIGGYLINEYDPSLAVEIRITTSDDEVRVDDEVSTKGGHSNQTSLGLVAEAGESLSVEAAMEGVGSASADLRRVADSVAIKATDDGDFSFGPFSDLKDY